MNPLRKQLVRITDLTHGSIYHPSLSPGHASWISLWKSIGNKIFISFQEMEGDRSSAPSYDFMKASDRDSYDIRHKFFSSTDQGASWKFESEKELFLPNLQFAVTKNPLPSGKILGAYPSRNLKKYAGNEGAVVIVSSSDGGRTWSEEAVLKSPVYKRLIPMSIIHDESAGTLLFAYTDAGDCLCFISGDGGKSWSDHFVLAKAGGNLSFWEPAVEKLAGNKFISIMRTHREDIPRHNGINYHKVIFSFDSGGIVASQPEDTGIGFRGKPELLKTSSGVMILAAPGHLFAFSYDDGNTWELHLDMMKGLPHNADPTLIETAPDRILCGYFFGSDYPFPPPMDQHIGCTKFKIKY